MVRVAAEEQMAHDLYSNKPKPAMQKLKGLKKKKITTKVAVVATDKVEKKKPIKL
jgi:hypothetical protein